MRLLGLLFTCLLAAGAVPAQETTPGGHAPPGVVFLKLKWTRELQLPRGWDRAAYDASSPVADPHSPNGKATLNSTGSPFPQSGGMPYVYHYTAKIRNDGAKQIKGVMWVYIFSDPGSRRELARHLFYHYEKISTGENTTLRGRSASAPTKVVTAKGLEKDARSPFDERAEIRCVMYADGTWWLHPAAKETECLSLRNRERMSRQLNNRW